MKELPKSIAIKVESYYKHSQKAEQLRVDIEEWFVKQGMEMENDADYPITDSLIDLVVDGDVEGTIEFLNKTLNDLN